MPPKRTVHMLLVLIVIVGIVIVLTATTPWVAVGCYVLGLVLGCLRRRNPRPS